MSQVATPRIAIFRAGTHRDLHGRDIKFTAEDLAAIAASYDTSKPAPLVLGHPKTDDPAYGWAAGLTVGEDGLLYAALDQVDASLAADVRAGRYRNVSASLWQPDHPSNPKPGSWYLRHIGLLGAASPAVSGLPPVNLASDAGVACFEFSAPSRLWGWSEVASLFGRVRDYLIEAIGTEKADQVVPRWQIDSLAELSQPETASAPAFAAAPGAPPPTPPAPTTEPAMTQPKNPADPADFAARESALSAREQEIAAREKAIADAERQRQRTEAVAFAAGLADAGRILPRHQAPLVEVLLALPPAPVSFAGEGGEESAAPAQLLRDFLGGLPAQVRYGEKSKDTGAAPAVAFAAPQGAQIDSRSAEIDAKARAFQVANPNTSYHDAVRAVGG